MKVNPRNRRRAESEGMPFPSKNSAKWKNQKWLEHQGLAYHKAKRNVPVEYPRDFELKDGDGKVYMRLRRGHPVELVGEPGSPAMEALEKARKELREGTPSHGGIPTQRALIPMPSQAGPVAVAPSVPAANVVNRELFRIIGTAENPFLPEGSKIDVSDARCQSLADMFSIAYPGVTVSPKIAFWVSVGLWQVPAILYVLKQKGKDIIAWFKKRFQKKDDKGEAKE